MWAAKDAEIQFTNQIVVLGIKYTETEFYSIPGS